MGLDIAKIRRFPLGLVDQMIEQFGLHDSWPVDLKPLYEALSVRVYHDIILPDELPAFSAYHKKQGYGIAVFTAGLDGPELSHAMGHEMGHLLCHKMHRPHGCITSPGGVVPREEQEADLVASYLMVPGQVFYELCKGGYNFTEISSLLNVPRSMLQMRADLMVAWDEFEVVSNPIYVSVD